MIKKNFKTICLATMLLSTSLMADELKVPSDTYSIIAVEAGYNRSSSQLNDLATLSQLKSGTDLSSIGLKIGAQTKDYRVFLSANYLNDYRSSYDYITTYGIAFQYKFNISKQTNMFIGLNGGIANMKFKLAGENITRTLSNPYIGGDAGFNFSISKVTDFEVGARYINIQSSNIKNNKEYILNDMVSYYTSFIFKFQMN